MRIWAYGDDINTDMLFPGKYTYTCAMPEEIKPHLLEDLDPEFAKAVQAGDVIFAGKNFGCGSSREQPVVGLKAVGIEAIVAKSYARIFYRAAINQGLLLIECPEAIAAYEAGMPVQLLLKESSIKVGDQTFRYPTLPPEILAIRDAGGLLAYTRAKLRTRADATRKPESNHQDTTDTKNTKSITPLILFVSLCLGGEFLSRFPGAK